MATFSDLRITGMDPKGATAVESSALMNVPLTLSGRPPYEWSTIFDQLWKGHISMSKRRAQVVGGAVMVTCVPEELEGQLMDDLKTIILDTNKAFSRHLAGEERKQAATKAAQSQQAQKLNDLKDRLKFD
jgi:hypothetical protein